MQKQNKRLSFKTVLNLIYPFIGQNVNQEAISTAQVHKGLSGGETFLCSLLSPQHLQYSNRDSLLVCVCKSFQSAAV